MKKLQIVTAIFMFWGVIGVAPVHAKMMENASDIDYTPEATCEGRIAELQAHRESKATVHANLNARQDELEVTAAELITQAKSLGLETKSLEKAIAQSRKNEQKVDSAYQEMDAVWADAEAHACELTAEEFAKAVNYQSSAARLFETLGLGAGEYIRNVVDKEIEALRSALQSAVAR